MATTTNPPTIPVANKNARVAPTADNPSGYPLFDIRLVPAYTNSQLRYYHTIGAMLDIDKTVLKSKMEERKIALDLVDWDGNTRENTPASQAPTSIATRTLSFDPDSEVDSECPDPIPSHKGIKFNPSDITRLRYDSNVAQFNNWLEDLKSAFDGDPSKFYTSHPKIILASMTIDEQLKTTYNSIVKAYPAISTHWRKFKRWIQDIVLHGDSDRLKLSNEFTTARQRVNEDPNQFYLRLFNLGIQSGRSVSIEDYRTRLVKPLQNLINQQDRTYLTIQDAVAHAARLWQTLDPDRVRQEIREDRDRIRQRRIGQSHQSGQPHQSGHSHQSDHSHPSGRSRQPDQQQQRRPRQTDQGSDQ